jgi:hypothetical protein
MGLQLKQSTEPAKIRQDFRAERGSHQWRNTVDELVARIDIDSGISIGCHWEGILAEHWQIGQRRESIELFLANYRVSRIIGEAAWRYPSFVAENCGGQAVMIFCVGA